MAFRWMGDFSADERGLLVAMMAPSALSLIANGMIGVALPAIQTEFRLPVELLAWVVAAAFVSRVALEAIYGWLADLFGKRRLYLVGLSIFSLGSVLLIPAPSFTWLVFASILQGIGMASFSIAMAMITNLFPKERRGRALGLWNSSQPFGIMMGPIIGGVVTEWLGWRANFVLIACGCLLALVTAIRFIPSQKQAPGKSFDWAGAVALVLAVGGGLLATTTESMIPMGSPLNLLFWVVSLLAIGALVWNAVKRPNPLIGVDVVRNRRFVGPALAVNFRMFAHDGARFVLVLYLANVLRYSPSSVGTLMFFYSLPLLIGVMYGGHMADRWATRTSGAIGTVGQATGLLWLGLAGETDALILAPGMIIAGFFSGASLVPFSKEAVAALGRERAGLASGLYNMLRYAGSAAAAPLLGLLLARGYEAFGGMNSAAPPYQWAFQILAVIAGLGALSTALIPGASPVELQTQ